MGGWATTFLAPVLNKAEERDFVYIDGIFPGSNFFGEHTLFILIFARINFRALRVREIELFSRGFIFAHPYF